MKCVRVLIRQGPSRVSWMIRKLSRAEQKCPTKAFVYTGYGVRARRGVTVQDVFSPPGPAEANPAMAVTA